jgi:hypothetical protein
MKLATACRTVWRTKKSACYPGELPVYGCGTISCPVLKIKRSRCFPVGRCGRSCPSPSKFNVLALVVATSTVAPTRLNRRTCLSLTSLEIGCSRNTSRCKEEWMQTATRNSSLSLCITVYDKIWTNEVIGCQTYNLTTKLSSINRQHTGSSIYLYSKRSKLVFIISH